jgi:hypothetical protein
MGGGGQTQQSNQVSQVQLPPWINQAAQQNYAFAQNVANRPLQQYQGQMVADPSAQQQQAWGTAANAPNVGQPQYGMATAGYLNSLGGGAPQVTPGALANTNLSPYMNPYTQNVINATLPIMTQGLQQNLIGNANQASMANAFGGSRQGIQQGVTQAQGALNMAQMAQQLNQANFGQAQTGAMGDINNQLAAATANQNAYLQNKGLQNQAAGGLASLGGLLNQNNAQNYMMQSSAGQQQQQQAQNQINANMQKFNQAWNYPGSQLGVLQSALGMTPYGQTQTTSGQTTTSAQTDPMMAGLGILQLAGGLFSSDKEEKTDVKKLGKVGDVPMYAYRYKGDPKTYPKVVGPMAQDIQKLDPSQVVSIAGSKAIRPGAGALAARVGKPSAHRPRVVGMLAHG